MPASSNWMARVAAMSEEPVAKVVSKPDASVNSKFQVKSQEILMTIPTGREAEIRISKTIAPWGSTAVDFRFFNLINGAWQASKNGCLIRIDRVPEVIEALKAALK